MFKHEQERTGEVFKLIRQEICCGNEIEMFRSFFLLHLLNILVETIFASDFIGSATGDDVAMSIARRQRERETWESDWHVEMDGVTSRRKVSFLHQPKGYWIHSLMDEPHGTRVLREECELILFHFSRTWTWVRTSRRSVGLQSFDDRQLQERIEWSTDAPIQSESIEEQEICNCRSIRQRWEQSIHSLSQSNQLPIFICLFANVVVVVVVVFVNVFSIIHLITWLLIVILPHFIDRRRTW